MNQVISASAVRNLIEKNDWEQIGQMVPHTTLEWIQRCCTKSNPECKNQKFSVMKQYIGSHDNIIVYGTGNSTAKLMDDMDLHDISKIIFCDKKASSQEYLFQNRKVISPEELYQFYRGYNILVTSSIYSKEIYMELRHHGIEADKIWCNTL